MNVSQFREEAKQVYAKYFDGSRLIVESTHGIFRNIVVSCYLVKDQSEAINGISQNDMFSIRFSITNNGNEFDREEYKKGEEMELTDTLTLESWAKEYTTKPVGPYCVYGSQDVVFRKTTGNAQHILKTLDKFFQRLNTQLHFDIQTGMIHKNHIELLTRRLK